MPASTGRVSCGFILLIQGKNEHKGIAAAESASRILRDDVRAFPFDKMIPGMLDQEKKTCPPNHSCLLFLELTQDIPENFFVFQADGKENGFLWSWMRHVNGGRCMEFGPVEEAIEGFLVFFAQNFAKFFPPSALFLQNMTERHDCVGHVFLQMMVS
jgi:hypothetical protein